MGAIFAVIVFPLAILNGLGGLVGGIWLLTLGQWQLVLAGFAWAGLAPFLLSILLMPGIGLAALGANTRGPAAFLSELLSITWVGCLMVGLAALIFDFALGATRGSGNEPLPFLLLAYGAATSPWVAMTRNGGSMGELTVVPLLSLQIASVTMAWTALSNPWVDLMALAVPGATAFAVAGVLLLTVFSMDSRRA